jgi:hypothetical protein
MLDVLHISDAAFVRRARAWYGRGRFLAGRINSENSLGEIRFLEASAGTGSEGTGSRIRQDVTYVTQNPIDTDKICPIM